MLLAAASRRMGIAERLAAAIPDRRDPTRIVHPLSRILLARILAIACGYEDADDLDTLRTDPALKLACGHLPESGAALASQPTVSRLENTPTLRDLIRRCCQTNQNSLKKPYPRRPSGRAKLTPLDKRGGAAVLKILSTDEVTLRVKSEGLA